MENEPTTKPSQPVCCPVFNPSKWSDQEINWTDKKFIRGAVRSFLHMPLNMGGVITSLCAKIDKSGVSLGPETIILSEEVSAWKSVQYISVKNDIPGSDNVALSGTFMTKVFEGPYRMLPKWFKEMEQYITSKGKSIKKIYTYYTTCPKCAKTQGKNYVVLFAQI